MSELSDNILPPESKPEVKAETQLEVQSKPVSSGFAVPLSIKFALIALCVVSVVVVIAYIFIRREINKRKNLSHELQVLNEEQENFKQTISQLENLNNSLNNRAQSLEQELEERKSQEVFLDQNSAIKAPSFEVSEDNKPRPKPKSPKQMIQERINKRRETNQDLFDKEEAEAAQQQLDENAEKQIKELVPEDSVVIEEPNDEDNTPIKIEPDDDLPISRIDKENVV